MGRPLYPWAMAALFKLGNHVAFMKHSCLINLWNGTTHPELADQQSRAMTQESNQKDNSLQRIQQKEINQDFD